VPSGMLRRSPTSVPANVPAGTIAHCHAAYRPAALMKFLMGKAFTSVYTPGYAIPHPAPQLVTPIGV
jgi:hypothetical protein